MHHLTEIEQESTNWGTEECRTSKSQLKLKTNKLHFLALT